MCVVEIDLILRRRIEIDFDFPVYGSELTWFGVGVKNHLVLDSVLRLTCFAWGHRNWLDFAVGIDIDFISALCWKLPMFL